MNKPVKVLHVSRYYQTGGAAKSAFRLHEALLEKGIDSSFICLEENMEENAHQISLLKYYKSPKNLGARIKNKIVQIISKTFKSKQVKVQQELKELLPKINAELASLPFSNYALENHPLFNSFDIINLHWVANEMLDYQRFFSACKKPIVWTLHDMNPFQGIFHYKNDMLLNHAIAGKLDDYILNLKQQSIQAFSGKMHIVAPSVWLTDASSKSTIFSKFPHSTIQYSLSLNTFKLYSKTQARQELGLPTEGVILLFVAESLNNYRKGFDLLLNALSILKMENVTIVALGEKIENADLAANIISTGRIKEESLMAKYYAAASAFILPSREDNLPNVMLESFSCGTPVIGFPVGGIKEHVINYKTGVLAKEISSESLAEAISDFTQNAALFDAKWIRNYAESNFNTALQANKYQEVYHEILSKS